MKCFVFAIGGLPDPIFQRRHAKKVADFLTNLDGFVGIHILDRWLTMICFETYNDAVRARNKIKAEGNSVADHIMNAEISDDKQNLTVLDPAD